MKNNEQFKLLVEERAAAQREAAALRARRRKIALRSAVAVVLALIILPVGIHLLGSPDLGGLSNNDMAVPNAPMEDGKEPSILDRLPEQAPGLPEGEDDEDGDRFDPEEEGTPQAPGSPEVTQKPEGPIDPEGPTNPESPDAPTAPEMLGFSTFDEIERFVAAANGSAEAYAEFINGLEHSFTASQATAQTIASHLTSAELPRPANAQSAEDFGCTYYADRVELDLIYRMKGIRYRFVYSYQPSEPHTYEGEPILTGLSLGSATLDLYSGTNCLVGSYQSGQTAVRVIVYTEQSAEVDFGQFDFQPITVQ